MERPNTVAGLIEKRRYTLALLNLDGADREKLLADIAAIDRVVTLFGGTISGLALKPKRFPAAHMAGKGEMGRLVLDTIRESGSPVTSPQIAALYCERHGIPQETETFANILSRVISRLTKMKQSGAVRKVRIGGPYRGWVL